jgi:cytochrome c-type biogenesis protein CcmH
MTGWLLAALLAFACFGVLSFLLKVPRSAWTAVGAALVLGLAGYALQAQPALPGAPKEAAPKLLGNETAMIEARRAFSGGGQPVSDNNWIVLSDALARHGQYADAADVLLGAVQKDPNNAEGWLALGNALVGHAEGTLTPAALYAYRHAAAAAPDQPGPPYFLGLALAQSGRFGEARVLWTKLLAASPPDAPWRGDLEAKLQRLDILIAMQQRAAASAR